MRKISSKLKVGDPVTGNGFESATIKAVRKDGLITVFDEENMVWAYGISPSSFRILTDEEIQRRNVKIEKARQRAELRRIEEEQRQKAKKEKERKEAELRRRKNRFFEELKNCLESNFLNYGKFYFFHPDKSLISESEALGLRSEFVTGWLSKEISEDLDGDQIESIAHSKGNLLVTARAGSGKTRTLVTKAIFLLKHCGVNPRELLLLAFNRKAAEEMKERISAQISGDLPHVMTFHALGHAIVGPEEELIYDDADSKTLKKSRDLQSAIDELIRTKEHFEKIRELMMLSFTDDWERIVGGEFHLPMEDFIKHKESLPRETLGRDYVKSFGEKLIANTLFRNNIDYKYEKNFHWNGNNYRPDFTLPTGNGKGVVIEYFGLKGESGYDEMSENKKQFWSEKAGWDFLEYNPKDITEVGSDAFAEKLLDDLEDLGIMGNPLSDEEIWEKVKDRAIDSFTKAICTFIGRCRKDNLGIADLRKRISNHQPANRSEELFLEVALSIYSRYLEYLKSENKEDFDGLMWRALEAICEGKKIFTRNQGKESGDLSRLRFVMIDEFQDFSELFYRITNSLLQINPGIRFFCVGDDWQAINSFAGSDLKYFSDFKTYFRSPENIELRTNYRSARQIINLGNSLMRGIGHPAVANSPDDGTVKLADLNGFSPTAIEKDRHEGDVFTPAVLRIIRDQLERGRNVTLLSRRNGIPRYVNYSDALKRGPEGLLRLLAHIRSFLPEEDRGKIEVSTVHKYKGKETKAVIVVDAVERSYPLVHPHWIYMRIFGDNLEKVIQEERRLFYVAISRPEIFLTLLTDRFERTQFIRDIEKTFYFEELNWEEYPPNASLDGPKLEIRVHHSYRIKDKLKQLGYRFNEKNRYWYRTVPEDGFSWEKLLSQDWTKERVKVEVLNEKQKRIYHKIY